MVNDARLYRDEAKSRGASMEVAGVVVGGPKQHECVVRIA
jgi:hypothetical protein